MIKLNGLVQIRHIKVKMVKFNHGKPPLYMSIINLPVTIGK